MPKDVVTKIVCHRIANKLPEDMPAVKYYCETVWHGRDPKRFKRPPAMTAAPAKPSTEWQKTILLPFFEAAQHSDVSKFENYKAGVLSQFFEHNCQECVSLYRAYVSGTKTNSLGDWAYGLYDLLMRHWGRTPKPKKLIAREWKINL